MRFAVSLIFPVPRHDFAHSDSSGLCRFRHPAWALPDAAANSDEVVDAFYQRHGQLQVWSGSDEARTGAGIAFKALSNAATEGLEAERYRVYPGSGLAAEAAITATLLARPVRERL